MAGSYKQIAPSDVKPRRSSLNQLVDVIQEDVSGSATRRKYQVFVTGGVGPGVTSSLYQTVYDQDFSLQTANAILDMSVGLFSGSDTYMKDTIQSSVAVGLDVTGKSLFPSSSLMMREKIDVYQQYAQTLLNNRTGYFTSPFDASPGVDDGVGTNSSPGDVIEAALFLGVKRLFARDRIRPETFAMRFYQTASLVGAFSSNNVGDPGLDNDWPNTNMTSISGSVIITDIGASTNQRTTHGGRVANLVDASNTDRNVGLIFYDHGTVVLDLKKVMSGSQFASGAVDAMSSITPDGVLAAGTAVVGGDYGANPNAKFIPDFICSASIDNILDHIASTRFQSGSLTALTFQNETAINSTLYFCRAGADDFNFSQNPSYTDSSGRVQVIDQGSETTQRSFTFVTSIGLHDAVGNLLACAKLSRPIEKNDEKDITFRIRLDY